MINNTSPKEYTEIEFQDFLHWLVEEDEHIEEADIEDAPLNPKSEQWIRQWCEDDQKPEAISMQKDYTGVYVQNAPKHRQRPKRRPQQPRRIERKWHFLSWSTVACILCIISLVFLISIAVSLYHADNKGCGNVNGECCDSRYSYDCQWNAYRNCNRAVNKCDIKCGEHGQKCCNSMGVHREHACRKVSKRSGVKLICREYQHDRWCLPL